MNEINNLELIKPLINSNDNEFYLLQIIHRSKDGLTEYDNNIHFSNKTIRNYYISNVEYLERKMPSIIEDCKKYNARAYINLNKKSDKQVTLKSLELLAHAVAHDDYKCYKSLIESVCGQTGACDNNKRWIVDVDTKDEDVLTEIVEVINKCKSESVEKIVKIIPTLHGFHIITKPFDKKNFRELYTEKIDIHDNNPTLLYFCEEK